MRINSRSSLNTLADLLDILANPEKTAAAMKQLRDSIEEQKKAAADAAAAVSEMSRARVQYDKDVADLASRHQSLQKMAADCAMAREDMNIRYQKLEGDLSNAEKRLRADIDKFEQEKAAFKAEDLGQQEFWQQRQAELAQAQRALDARAKGLSEREAAVDARAQDIEHRFAELRRLAG